MGTGQSCSQTVPVQHAVAQADGSCRAKAACAGGCVPAGGGYIAPAAGKWGLGKRGWWHERAACTVVNLAGFVTALCFWQSLLGYGNESLTGPDSEIHRLSAAIRQQHSQRAEETLSRSGPCGFFKSKTASNIFNPSRGPTYISKCCFPCWHCPYKTEFCVAPDIKVAILFDFQSACFQ